MIRLNHINVTFGKPVLRDAEIRIPRGKVTAITGDSGCGKTTVLYILGMMSSQQDLQYIYDGKEIDLHDRAECRRLAREEFGFLFQDHSLIETLTVSENLIQLAALAKRTLTDSEIDSLLKEVDLDPSQKDAYPKQLSGGEQQRAALAGVLARKPRCIFADEPTSALDRTNTQKIIQIFKSLAERGITVVIASHSDAVCDAADCLYHLEDQKIVLDRGSAEDNSKEPEQAARSCDCRLLSDKYDHGYASESAEGSAESDFRARNLCSESRAPDGYDTGCRRESCAERRRARKNACAQRCGRDHAVL